MGAGKSAVGRQLGRLLHLDFMDTDDEIEAMLVFLANGTLEGEERERILKIIRDSIATRPS